MKRKFTVSLILAAVLVLQLTFTTQGMSVFGVEDNPYAKKTSNHRIVVDVQALVTGKEMMNLDPMPRRTQKMDQVNVELNEYPSVMIGVSSLAVDGLGITLSTHKETYLFNEESHKVWILVLHGTNPEWRAMNVGDTLVRNRMNEIFLKAMGRTFFD